MGKEIGTYIKNKVRNYLWVVFPILSPRKLYYTDFEVYPKATSYDRGIIFLKNHSVIVTNRPFCNRLLVRPWEARGFGKGLTLSWHMLS